MTPSSRDFFITNDSFTADIQAVGDQALLDKYGLKANDAILAEEKHIPLYEDLLNNFDAKLIAGGAAQNSARGAQYILSPNSVVYLGGAGDDKYSAIMTDATKAAGLRTEYRVDPSLKTGRCGVVITGHNRSLCTDLGAANHYDLDHLKKPEIWSLVENAQVYYVGGYHFTGMINLCDILLLVSLLRRARSPKIEFHTNSYQCAHPPSWSSPSRPLSTTRSSF